MTHPLPQSLAAIVKAEAENSWNDFRNKAIPGTEGTVQSGYFGYAAFPQTAYCHGFSAAAQFLFAHLSEPGEACGPHLMIQSSPLSADKEEYVPLTELLQARAAGATALEANRLNHEILRSSIAESWSAELEAAKAALASSEARVRILSEALEKIAELQGSPVKSSAGWAGQVARQALLEVQR